MRTAAARSFVRSKPASDRIAVVAVGKQAFQLTGFSSGTSEADAALRTLEVDKVRGTALYDAVVLSSRVARRRRATSRASSCCSQTGRRSPARRASTRRSPPPAKPGHGLSDRDRKRELQAGSRSSASPPKRAAATAAPPGPKALQSIYTALAQELRRTWQLTYFTTARPGDTFEVAAAGVHALRRWRQGSQRVPRLGVVGAGPGVRSWPDAGRHAGRPLHPRRRNLPLEGAGRSRAAQAARAAHR